MKKVIVIGSPGAGKSMFARQLHYKTNLPLYYLDKIWHRPDKTNVSREEFDACLEHILGRDKWIIDGNYLRTLAVRMQACDTVYFLDYPVDVCLAGAQSRIGRMREDMPWVETEFDEEFREWIINFPRDQLPEIYKRISEYRNQKEVHIFTSRQEADHYLEQVGREAQLRRK